MFIILGIVIIGLISSFVVYRENAAHDAHVAVPSEIVASDKDVQDYVDACLTSEAEPLIQMIANQGGTFSPVASRPYNGVNYSYLCIQSSAGCINQLRTRQYMESEFSREIINALPGCLDFAAFRSQGYNIVNGSMSSGVKIGPDTVFVTLNYPLEVHKGNYNFKSDKFTVTLQSNLGRLYDLANQILNSEIESGAFDKDAWMQAHGASIQIDKHRPYPDTVYTLTSYRSDVGEKLKFNFAVQGLDTVSSVDAPQREPPKIAGYCYTPEDSNCFANTPSSNTNCEKYGGTFSINKPAACTGISTYNNGCTGSGCKSCGTHKSGDTWCEYDGVTGNGLDLVGSRQYLRSCFDGRLYFEDCRDFREEMCVNDNGRAACRQNRWQDCIFQYNQPDCLNSTARDCVWEAFLQNYSYVPDFANHNCIPNVPPGFRHWQYNGIQVCQMANAYNDCDGITCPAAWTDSTGQYCLSMGDCGNYRNIAGQISSNGFFSSNGNPRPYIYLDGNGILQGQDYVLNGKLDVNPLYFNYPSAYLNPISNINAIAGKLSDYANTASSWNVDDFMWQYIWHGKVNYWTRQISMCGVWQSPSASKCELCSSDPTKPCSEYRCLSLGSQCIYSESNGFGNCTYQGVSDKTPVMVKLDRTSLPAGYTARQDMVADYNGYEISPSVNPYDLFKFSIITNKDTQCKLSFIPSLPFDSIIFPPGEFSTHHDFYYRLPDIAQIVTYIHQITQFGSVLQLARVDSLLAKIDGLKSDAEHVAKKFHVDISGLINQIDVYENNFRQNIKPQLENIYSNLKGVISIITAELEANRHIVFVNCIDRAGNQASQEIYLLFNVSVERAPPMVIQDNSRRLADKAILFNVFLNKAADCRYSVGQDSDFFSMQPNMDCKPAYSDNLSFYYSCESTDPIAFNPPQTNVYLRCADKLPGLTKYYVGLAPGTTTVLSTFNETMLTLDEGSLAIHDLTGILASNKVSTQISEDTPVLNFSFSTPIGTECRYSNDSLDDFSAYNGSFSCDPDSCSALLDVYKRDIYMACMPTSGVNRSISNVSTEYHFS